MTGVGIAQKIKESVESHRGVRFRVFKLESRENHHDGWVQRNVLVVGLGSPEFSTVMYGCYSQDSSVLIPGDE